MLKSFFRSPRTTEFAGRMIGRYLQFVYATSRVTIEPPDLKDRVRALSPFVLAAWHGEDKLLPFAIPRDVDTKAIVSRSHDGDIVAATFGHLGIGAIRASGGTTGEQIARRGGVAGVMASLKALAAGSNVALTADVPKGPARVAGEGIVAIARLSGRPIIPFAVATSNRFRIKNTWDKAAVYLPFSRLAMVMGEPIRVARDASTEEVEAARTAVAAGLDAVLGRAYAIVDRTHG